MDFLRRCFFKNEPLIGWAFLSSKLDFPVIKTLERNSLNVKKYLCNILIIGESNFDERNGQKNSTDQRLILKEITTYKIHTSNHSGCAD